MYINHLKNNILDEFFTENDALYLQNLFLTPGVHQINSANLSQVRILIKRMLTCLQYYQNVAGLSLQEGISAIEAVDLMQLLIAEDHLINADRLTLFFFDHFYFYFLWIEETPELLLSPWYNQFQRHLHDFGFDRTIPVIKVCIDSH